MPETLNRRPAVTGSRHLLGTVAGMSKPALWSSLLCGAAVLAACGGAVSAGARAVAAQRPCPTAATPGAGSFAWAAGGTLRVVDLRTCRVRVLVSRGAAPPVRISPDGRWVGFGSGSIVPIGGGRVKHPLGAGVASWQWSPQFGCKPGYGCTPVGLAGVTRGGGVTEDTLGSPRRVLLAPGFGAGQLLYDGSGGTLFVVRGLSGEPGQIWRLDLTAGTRDPSTARLARRR